MPAGQAGLQASLRQQPEQPVLDIAVSEAKGAGHREPERQQADVSTGEAEDALNKQLQLDAIVNALLKLTEGAFQAAASLPSPLNHLSSWPFDARQCHSSCFRAFWRHLTFQDVHNAKSL